MKADKQRRRVNPAEQISVHLRENFNIKLYLYHYFICNGNTTRQPACIC